MSRATKGEASAAAAILAVDTLVSAAASDVLPAANAVRSAEPAERQNAAVLLTAFEGIPRGVVVTGTVSRIDALIDGKTARQADERDLAVAGRNVRPI